MSDPIRWGILGSGSIAKKFAQGLTSVEDAELIAVGSRSQASADAFGEQFNIARRYASHDAFLSDPDVQVVYVASPHPMHRPNAIACLEAGKAVLCEKPFTVNAGEARQIVDVARDKGLFLMEAMWSRFFPVMQQVRKWLADGEIGDVRFLTADFGFRSGVNPEGRLWNPNLAGGALLDVGVYPVSLASMVFALQPAEIATFANMGETGVDAEAAMLFRYHHGGMAKLHTAIRCNTTMTAHIEGTEGKIILPTAWWRPQTVTLEKAGADAKTITIEPDGNGMHYEARCVNACLREGRTECDQMPLDETIAVMETLDRIRGAWGLRYPMEG